MFDENKEKQFILQLFNLEYSDVQDVSCIRAGNTVIIDITLASDPVPCPVCGCDQPHIKNYVTKNITHSVLSDRRCTLRYHARRYVCPVCGKTYYEHNPFVFKSDINSEPVMDPNAERKWNGHFRRYMNLYEIKDLLFGIDPQLQETWNLKDSIVDFYSTATVENAAEKLNRIIEDFDDSSVTEMNAFAKTLKKWRKEIINSFHIAGYEYQIDQSTGHVAAQEKKMNNAIIENRNSIIKCIKKNANGYTNWTRFRNRVLYVLDKNSSYSMYPMKKEKKQ